MNQYYQTSEYQAIVTRRGNKAEHKIDTLLTNHITIRYFSGFLFTPYIIIIILNIN